MAKSINMRTMKNYPCAACLFVLLVKGIWEKNRINIHALSSKDDWVRNFVIELDKNYWSTLSWPCSKHLRNTKKTDLSTAEVIASKQPVPRYKEKIIGYHLPRFLI
jgi:hypothetical protein